VARMLLFSLVMHVHVSSPYINILKYTLRTVVLHFLSMSLYYSMLIIKW
jgi:hypothetical protein